MPKKKRVRKKTSRKKGVIVNEKKISIALKSLVLFGVLALVSFMLYTVSSNVFYRDLFFMGTMILGFIAAAFVIVILLFLVMRAMKK
jgi:hypothetical protein